MCDNLRRQMQNISLGIADEPISLPPEICNHATAVNQFFLVVVPLNPAKQNLRAMISQLPRLWGMESAATGRIIGQNRLQFLFQSEETMNLVLRRSPWSFAEWMITITRWAPNLPDGDCKIILFRIQIWGIPLQFLSRPTITFIGDIYGPVISVDFDETSTRVDFVLRVLWDTDNPLHFQHNFQFEAGVNTILRFKYERLQKFCKRCGMISHERKDCPIPANDEDDFSGSDGDDDSSSNDPHQRGAVASKDPAPINHSADDGNPLNPVVTPSDSAMSQNLQKELQLQELRRARGKFREDDSLDVFEDSARDESGFNKRKRQKIERC
ncbi:uncharacterized protein LOC112084667 [Eutrema salsugineum]|uniref:uncharacterized protein LOC112084667 n=1 Tax=Eutrema salsugineum TaxID=72664 RepID=UPI000CED7D4E|nr:uncharacterized protein LOC112084667 [Eutrema salsugineum]